MTVSSTQATETFSCDAATTVFTCPFRVLAAEDMLAYLVTISTGASELLTNGVDYTVTGVGDDNAIITTTETYSALYELKAQRETARRQETDYRDNDPFPAESHEEGLDRLTMIMQEHDEALGRTIRAPGAEALNALPSAADRALRTVGFDSDGNVTVNTPSDGSAASLALLLAGTGGAEGASMLGWIQSGAGAVARTMQAKGREVISPQDYGTDANVSFPAAMTELAARGGGVFFIAPGTYTFTTLTGFTIPDNVHILQAGAVLDFSGAAEAARIRITGSIGANVALTANVAVGAADIPLASVDGLAAGDLLLLSSDDLVPLDDIGGTTDETIGEFVTIKSISGLTVTVDGYLDGAYLTADAAKVQKVAPTHGVVIQGGKIIGRGTRGDGVTSAEIGISALYARGLRLNDVEIEGCDYQAIALDQCYDCLVDNPTIRQEDRGNVAFDIIQYGIAPKNASSKITVRGGTITGGKHGVAWTENTLPGVGRDVTVDGTTIIGTWAAAIATHESNERFDIHFVKLIGCERGMDIRVRNGRIVCPHIRGVPSSSSIGDGIYLSENCGRIQITQVDIDGVRYGIRMYDVGLPNDATPTEITIQGGKIRNVSQIGIHLEHSENSNAKKGITIKGIDLIDVAGDYIRLHGAFEGSKIQGVNFLPINVAPTSFGVRLMGTSKTWITDSHFGGALVPVRTEVSTESVPATPTDIFMVNNTWESTGGFLSSTASSNAIRTNNTQLGKQALTIAAGVITVPSGHKRIIIDTEGAAAADDLVTINGGDVGDIIVIGSASSLRAPTVKDGTGNVQLPGGDFVLDNVADALALINVGNAWRALAPGANNA